MKIKSPLFQKLAVSFFLATASVSVLNAVEIVGNLQAFTNNATSSQIDATLVDGKSIGFTMSSQAFDHITVSLRLGMIDSAGDIPLIQIWTADASNTPGALYGTLTNPTFTLAAASSMYTFTAATTLTLDASTRYFIVVQDAGTAGTSFTWTAGSPSVAPTGYFATPGPIIFGPGNPGVWTSTSGVANWFEVDGIAVVPEPSTGALLFLGLGGLYLLRKTAHRRAAV